MNQTPRRGLGTALTVVVSLVLALGLLAAAAAVILALDGSDVDDPDLGYTPPPTLDAPAPPTPDPSTSAPPEPEPEPEPEITAAQILERNELYRTGELRSAGCAGESQVPLDSVPHLRTYYDSVLGCLNRTWAQVSKALPEFRPARLVVHNGEPVSACGAYAFSFYCTAEETISCTPTR